jgi:hypothetical protein
LGGLAPFTYITYEEDQMIHELAAANYELPDDVTKMIDVINWDADAIGEFSNRRRHAHVDW